MLASLSTNHINNLTGSKSLQRVSFSLAPSYTDKDFHTWTRSEWTTRAPSRPPHHQLLSEHHLKQRVLNVFIPSGAWDTACTSNAGKLGVKFIPTALKSTRVFALANGHPTPATNISLLKHKHLREAERTLHIVVALAHQSLLSGGQFSNAG